MKVLIGVLSLMSLLAFSSACNRNNPDRGMQREESIGGDDLRETDSYKQSLPSKEDEDMGENKDTIEMGPDDSTVED